MSSNYQGIWGLETKSFEFERVLKKVNTTYDELISLYTMLVERGINETEYKEIFENLIKDFKDVYKKSKSYYDELVLHSRQFEEGRRELDAFGRRLRFISEEIHDMEFQIAIKILPNLKKVEKELLNEQVIKRVEEFKLPKEVKKEVRQEAENIQKLMKKAEEKDKVDQVSEYVSIGDKIVKLGEKVWKFAKTVSPVALPIIQRIFTPS